MGYGGKLVGCGEILVSTKGDTGVLRRILVGTGEYWWVLSEILVGPKGDTGGCWRDSGGILVGSGGYWWVLVVTDGTGGD